MYSGDGKSDGDKWEDKRGRRLERVTFWTLARTGRKFPVQAIIFRDTRFADDGLHST